MEVVYVSVQIIMANTRHSTTEELAFDEELIRMCVMKTSNSQIFIDKFTDRIKKVTDDNIKFDKLAKQDCKQIAQGESFLCVFSNIIQNLL